jgi:hypothetical protein
MGFVFSAGGGRLAAGEHAVQRRGRRHARHRRRRRPATAGGRSSRGGPARCVRRGLNHHWSSIRNLVAHPSPSPSRSGRGDSPLPPAPSSPSCILDQPPASSDCLWPDDSKATQRTWFCRRPVMTGPDPTRPPVMAAKAAGAEHRMQGVRCSVPWWARKCPCRRIWTPSSKSPR